MLKQFKYFIISFNDICQKKKNRKPERKTLKSMLQSFMCFQHFLCRFCWYLALVKIYEKWQNLKNKKRNRCAVNKRWQTS